MMNYNTQIFMILSSHYNPDIDERREQLERELGYFISNETARAKSDNLNAPLLSAYEAFIHPIMDANRANWDRFKQAIEAARVRRLTATTKVRDPKTPDMRKVPTFREWVKAEDHPFYRVVVINKAQEA